MRRAKAVMVKEFRHILRDPTSLVIVFLMPLLMMFIYGYSISFDLDRIDAGIIDLSDGDVSRQLVRAFSNNNIYHITNLESLLKLYPNGDIFEVAERQLKSGKLKEVIVIPRDFSRDIKGGRTATLGIIIDGSDSNVANRVYQYNEMVIRNFTAAFLPMEKMVDVGTRILFNPELKSTYFFVPGLTAILLVMISALLTSISISREKENGSIDLLFISPLRAPEIIIGKTVPYILVALVVGAQILLFARFWFGVPIRGNLLLLLVFSLLYIIAGLSMGILISTVASSQKTAMFAALLSTLLPSIMLSGFIFPLDSMAPVLRGISHLVPATYFLRIVRGVVVKGGDLKHFVDEGVALIIFSTVLLGAATVKFARSRKKGR